MKVTPLDLRQQRFKTSMRGYDRDDVHAFLEEAAEDYETAVRENDRMRQEVVRLEAVINEHRSQERNLRNTLMTAQKLADDIREGAQQDAARIVREAEGRADLLLQKTQVRLEDVQREIDGLKMKRREVETSITALVSTLESTLQFVRDQDAREREDKVLLHRPRVVAPEAAPAAQASAAPAAPVAVRPAADQGSR
ncbi:MAG: DivIVA domain-containing protein [Vicinamibacterales bacterium]|nr:DivIVA domain-containing protein [Vicinamibacterales bacterium]